jgi:hypothetical protein
LGTFCICRTENILCESGFEDLIERRKRNIIEMALHVAEEAEHPMNEHLENRRAYDQGRIGSPNFGGIFFSRSPQKKKVC